jgi:hypothetical protein
MLHVRIGMLRAMDRGKERVCRTDHKEQHWSKRTLKRDSKAS